MSAALTWRAVQDLAGAAQDVAPGIGLVAEYPTARLTYGSSELLLRVRSDGDVHVVAPLGDGSGERDRRWLAIAHVYPAALADLGARLGRQLVRAEHAQVLRSPAATLVGQCIWAMWAAVRHRPPSMRRRPGWQLTPGPGEVRGRMGRVTVTVAAPAADQVWVAIGGVQLTHVVAGEQDPQDTVRVVLGLAEALARTAPLDALDPDDGLDSEVETDAIRSAGWAPATLRDGGVSDSETGASQGADSTELDIRDDVAPESKPVPAESN